jgi:hypothetical protein
VLRVESRGAHADGSATAAMVAVAPSLVWRISLTERLRIRAELEAQLLLTPARFVVEGVGTVHEPDRVSPVAALGLELRL